MNEVPINSYIKEVLSQTAVKLYENGYKLKFIFIGILRSA